MGAVEESQEVLGGVFKTRDDLVSMDERAGADVVRQDRARFIVAFRVVERDEAFHPSAFREELNVIPWSGWRRLFMDLADRAAKHDPPAEREASEADLEELAADGIEKDIDPSGRGGFERRVHVFIFIVDGAIEAEIFKEEALLLFAAGDADHACSMDLGELRCDHADATGCRGDHDGLAGLRSADLGESKICREPISAAHAQMRG